MKLSEIQAQGGNITPVTKLSGISKSAIKPADFRFRDVPKATETREEKIARYKREADAAAAEAKDANSALGFAKNFGKAFVSTVMPSEVGLGETIAKISQDPRKIAENIAPLQQKQVELLRAIREKEARGEDTTKMKQIYNSNEDFIKSQSGEIDKYNADLPSTEKVAGQLGGTALDIATAGTYGKAAAGLKTGVLGKASLVPTAVKTVAGPGKARGILTLSGLARVATGGGIGYASDVTRGLQGERGKDREGAAAFIPGAGTAIGAAIPAALETEKTVIDAAKAAKTALDPDTFVKKRTTAFKELFGGTVKTKNLETKMNAKGNDVASVLASDDRYVPQVIDGKINSDKAVSNVQDQIDPLAKIVRAVVEDEHKYAKVDDLKNLALSEIDDLKLRGSEYDRVRAGILSDIDFYAKQFGTGENGDLIPLNVVDDIKIEKYKNINWNNPELLSVDRAISRAARKTVERSITDVDVGGLNKELGKLYDAQEMLEALNGRAVKGGRLGKGFARLLGGVIGAKGGPAGSLAGSMTAEKVADIMQTNYFGNPLVKQALGDIQKESPEIFAQAQEILAQRAAERAGRLALPQSNTIVAGPPKIAQEGAKVFTDYGKFREAMGVPLPPTEPLALPPGGSKPIPIPPRLPSAVDAAEAAARASGAIKTDGFPIVGQVEKAAAGSPQAVVDAVARHITEGKMVLDNLDPATIQKEGGIGALIANTQNNIVRDLASEGAQAAADAISKLSASAFRNLDEFAAAVAKIVGK